MKKGPGDDLGRLAAKIGGGFMILVLLIWGAIWGPDGPPDEQTMLWSAILISLGVVISVALYDFFREDSVYRKRRRDDEGDEGDDEGDDDRKDDEGR